MSPRQVSDKAPVVISKFMEGSEEIDIDAVANKGEVPFPYTLHPTPYTLHPTPYTLHPTPYTNPNTPPTSASSRGLVTCHRAGGGPLGRRGPLTPDE